MLSMLFNTIRDLRSERPAGDFDVWSVFLRMSGDEDISSDRPLLSCDRPPLLVVEEFTVAEGSLERFNPEFHKKDAQKQLYFINVTSMTKQGLNWDPKPISKANNLRKVVEIETIHGLWEGFAGIATYDEVMSQIPLKYFTPQLAAFMTTPSRKNDDGPEPDKRYFTTTLFETI